MTNNAAAPTITNGKALQALVNDLDTEELERLRDLANRRLVRAGRPKPQKVIDVRDTSRYGRVVRFVAVDDQTAQAAAGRFGELRRRRIHERLNRDQGSRLAQDGYELRVSTIYSFSDVVEFLDNYPVRTG